MPASDSHYVVALSGGVAAGKSAAAARFSQRGIAVYDADLAARQVVRRGEPAFDAIVNAFGSDVVGPDGELDRHLMRRRVFASTDWRRRLEAIVHPEVQRWLRARVAGDRGVYCVLAIPLLVETWPRYAWVDRVVIVDVPVDVQRLRLMERDAIGAELAEAMLAAQATREQRLAIADDVIDNAGDPERLASQVDALDTHYRQLAARKFAV